MQQWLADKKPDVIVLVANEHVTSFFSDHYSHFTLRIGDEWTVADEGGGPRNVPPVKGHPALAQHIVSGLVADEFDMSVCSEPTAGSWVLLPAFRDVAG